MPLRSLRIRACSLAFGVLGASTTLAACTETKSEPPAPKTTPLAPVPTLSNGETRDAKDAGAAAHAAKDAAPPTYDGPLIGALFLQTPVMSDMEWPKEDKKTGEKTGSVRLGYIRQGQRVPVIAEAHPKANCKEGWYELVQGGFVCGKYASLDANHPRVKLAPHAPDMVSSLPYQYGYNVANGTPLYRQIPSREERVQIEPWLAPKAKRSRRSAEGDTASSDEMDAGSVANGNAALTLARSTQPVTSGSDPLGVADALDAGVPWYLREYDGGKPQVTLDDLRGEGPVSRRMVKGFFLALDKDFGASGSRWWKTTAGLLAPYERVMVYKQASDFHGVWMDENASGAVVAQAMVDGGAAAAQTSPKKEIADLAKPGSKAQVAIIVMYKSKKYIVSTSKKAVTTGDPISRHSVLRLTGESVTINGATYDETDDGWWMKASEGVKTNPGAAPKDLKDGEKWVDVNVKTQTLVAYEGDKPVFATAVSTGLVDSDKEKDHHTPPGTFRIREKHIAATMDGDVASDGPYSIEDVPWIMYFNGSYALHGAFWHNQFGRTKSHGCVNLAPQDAKALFAWTEPHLPEGWHGVMSTTEKPGTRVVVHD